MTDDEARGLEHAWRYFALHAEQRMTVFNFYVASAGLALTGLAWTLADGSKKWPLGAAAGIGAAALSFVFWRLDQRGAQLVKTAEDALAAIEGGLPPATAVITVERRLSTNGGWRALGTPWTFGRSFRLLFSVVSLLGVGGAVATIWQGTHVTQWKINNWMPGRTAPAGSQEQPAETKAAETSAPVGVLDGRSPRATSTGRSRSSAVGVAEQAVHTNGHL